MVALALAAGANCGDSSTGTTSDVTAAPVGSPGDADASFSVLTQRGPTDFHRLLAIDGKGFGRVRVVPFFNGGTFAAHLTVQLHEARPTTTYVFQRAPEIGRPLSFDGACQRALMISPWSAADVPVVPAFVSFPLPNPDPLITLTTDARGEAKLDFDFKLAGLPTPLDFDVMFRVLENVPDPRSILQSDCISVSAP
ncbi:MAG TPA: hypothetical protein VIC59_06930 [Gemmatimonadota bacterium]